MSNPTAQPAAVDKATPRPWRVGFSDGSGKGSDATHSCGCECPHVNRQGAYITSDTPARNTVIAGPTPVRGDQVGGVRCLSDAELIVRSVNQAAGMEALYDAAFFARNRLLQDSGDQESIDKLNRALAAVEQLRKGEADGE